MAYDNRTSMPAEEYEKQIYNTSPYYTEFYLQTFHFACFISS